MNEGYRMAASYYAATAQPFTPAPQLEGELRCDVVVIGGGYTGLHAALNAAEAGMSVILLEGGRIGWGASGRNGGQMIPGWRKGASDLVAKFGEAKAKQLFTLALEARDLVRDRITKHAIQCDLRSNGHLTLAAKSRDPDWMREEADVLARVMDYPQAGVLSRDEAQALVHSPHFHGGLFDQGGGALHPLNYALGLGDAARAAGVQVFEHSAVIDVSTESGIVARTAHGAVYARYGVMACDALLGSLDPALASRIMPVGNYVIATEPLRENVVENDLAVSDSRFVVNYFRQSADRRLLFSGGERYSPTPPHDIEAFVRPHMEQLFPQLRGAKIEHAWGGLVSITMTRFPHIGRRGNLFYAHGYSGQGVLLTALAGKVLVEAMRGTAERFDVLSSIAPSEFPGGTLLRTPAYVLAMFYYALRDRL